MALPGTAVTLVSGAGDVLGVTDAAGYPDGAVVLQPASGSVAAAVAVATLPAAAGKTNYLCDFDVSFAGATAAAVVVLTVTGLKDGTRSYIVSAPAGATSPGAGFQRSFDPPLVASAANVAIIVTLPSLGAGNTNASVNAHGFQL